MSHCGEAVGLPGQKMSTHGQGALVIPQLEGDPPKPARTHGEGTGSSTETAAYGGTRTCELMLPKPPPAQKRFLEVSQLCAGFPSQLGPKARTSVSPQQCYMNHHSPAPSASVSLSSSAPAPRSLASGEGDAVEMGM